MPSIEKKTQRQVILHFWNSGVKSAKELYILTKIPLSTIYYNIEKLAMFCIREVMTDLKKLRVAQPQAIGQYIRRETPLSLRPLATILAANRVNLVHMTILRYLKDHGY